MLLSEVRTDKDEADFIRINVDLNKGYEQYIRPLDKDILEVFDREKNKTFRHGECIRWILKNDDVLCIG